MDVVILDGDLVNVALHAGHTITPDQWHSHGHDLDVTIHWGYSSCSVV